jgi:4-hydroxy-tetrahydrodipicolinate reductase
MYPNMKRVAIHGACGRMGQRLVALTREHAGLELAGEFDQDAPISVEGLVGVDVVIDFSAASALSGVLAACRASKAALVLGTTGLDASHQSALDQASKAIAVLQASNFSLVVNVLHHLAAQAVTLLGEGWDLEVLEMHHRYKLDAPSGTAMALAHTIAQAAGRSEDCIKLARHGHHAPRQPSDITVQTLRVGDHPGEHTLFFAAPGERLELKHVSTSRDSYASGAVRAADWIAGKPAGRYQMCDVLGLPGGEQK